MKKFLIGFLLVSTALTAAIERKDVAEQDRWDLSILYASEEDWRRELEAVVPRDIPPFFPQLATYKGELSKSAQNLYQTIITYYDIERLIRKLGTFTQLNHDVDLAEPQAKANDETVRALYNQFVQESAWIASEILSLPESFIDDPLLADYRFLLQKLMRLKPHVPDAKAGELIALATPALEASQNAYFALSDADIKFDRVLDSTGASHELTHANYGLFMRSEDRLLRKNSFLAYHRKFLENENTLTELMAGTVKAHIFTAVAKNYSSCLEAQLKPTAIDLQVYHNLIDAVHSKIDALHRYMHLRKKVLKLDELHFYDLKVPLTAAISKSFTFDEAQNIVLEAVAPLGREYVSILQDGLKNKRWVDRYENCNKTSGAYSTGCFDSMPYILMNFDGNLTSVFTLAHEAGHSMHRLYSQSQPYYYSEYVTFVAEVASTFNEELLRRMLLKASKTDAMRAYLINQQLEDIQAVLFRQVLFAEFELFMHDAAEKRIPLTAKLLKDKYLELCRVYFGPDVTIDPELAIEWAHIPHFHLNFYVYQYATGASAALHLADMVLNGSERAQKRYLEFLRSGGSDDPLNLLAKAGCDMRSLEPVQRTLDHFSCLVDDLEKLLTE